MKTSCSLLNLNVTLLVLSLLFGCQKGKHAHENSTQIKVQHKLKSITEYQHKFLFGEPEKEGKKEYSTVFKFDSTGKLLEKSKYKGDGSLYEKYTYEYDANTVLSAEYEYEWYKDFKDPLVSLFKYDSLGKIIEEKTVWDKSSTSTRTYQYDSLGRLSETIYSNLKGKITRLKYKYDNRGNEIEAVRSGVALEGKWSSTYISDTLVAQREWYNSKGILNSRLNFTYDNNRKLLECVGHAYPDNRLYYKETFKYDSIGLLIERNEYSFSNIGEPEQMDRFVYEYFIDK